MTCDLQTRCGAEKGEAEEGVGECGKESCLTQQVLDSPRLPVSHPQTRPNQSTGSKHMLRHTGTDPHRPTVTRSDTDSQADKSHVHT